MLQPLVFEAPSVRPRSWKRSLFVERARPIAIMALTLAGAGLLAVPAAALDAGEFKALSEKRGL